MAAIRKVVIPVAGLGTRVLPASKVIPKEMLTIVDKPVIQYVVEEAIAAGLTDIILVTRAGKTSIEEHFAPHLELEAILSQKGKTELLESIKDILPTGINLSTVTQDQPLGLGHAVLCAAPLVAGEDFVVSLPDVLIFNPRGQHNQDMEMLVAHFKQHQNAQIMVETVAPTEVDRYGIVDCGGAEFEPGSSHEILAMVEKPAIDKAPSNQSIAGRYVLPGRIMEILKTTRSGIGDEIQLTDAINQLITEESVRATSMIGKTYDCGHKLGYLIANTRFAMAHQELGEDFKTWLRAESESFL